LPPNSRPVDTLLNETGTYERPGRKVRSSGCWSTNRR